MRSADFRRFIRQFQRFGAALAGYLVDVFRYDWKRASYMIGTSLAGISLQAASLGSVLMVARSYEDALRSGSDPSIDVPVMGSLAPSVALVGIIALLALSVFLLYESQRSIYGLSIRFANWRASALLTDYPMVAEQIDEIGVDGRSGVPVGLTGEMSRRATALNRTGRTLFGGAMGLLQCVYGVLFLLYIQPVVTLVVVLVAAPLIVPLRKFARQVNDAEKGRRSLRGNARSDMAQIVEQTSGAVPGSRVYRRLAMGQYQQTKVARNNAFILDRFIGMARNKAVANTGLTLTFAVSIALFFGVYGAENVSISSILVFFVALRVAAMGGRQMVARITRFARFYDPVRYYLNAYHHGRRRRLAADCVLSVEAPRAEDGQPTSCTLERGVPVAVFGAFPLAPLNLHMLGFFAEGDPGTTRGDLVAGMTFVPAHLELAASDSWRDWLPATRGADLASLLRRAERECPPGSVPDAGIDPASSVLSTPGFVDTGTGEIDLGLLAAWVSSAEVIVLPAEAVDCLGARRWDQWRRALADRYLLVYYEAGRGEPCRGGEARAVLVDFSGAAVAISSAEWLRENAVMAEEWVSVEVEWAAEGVSGDEDMDDED